MPPKIQAFFDSNTHTFSYVVHDVESRYCAIIDSVLDYDSDSATIKTIQADQIIEYVDQEKLTVMWILETHIHADHLSAAQYLKKALGGKVAMSENMLHVQKIFGQIYDIDLKSLNILYSFDYLFKDAEHFKIGELWAYTIATPGHTPACLSYVIGEHVFVGDTLFMPDYGSARCDFPQGSASQLYDSVQRLYQLPDHTTLYLCHDYLPQFRDKYCYKTTIAEQKKLNIHLNLKIDKMKFIQLREQRDRTLALPKLILPAIQINIQGGHMPQANKNGIRYLKFPLNYFE